MIRCRAIVQSANTSSRKLLFLAVLLAAQLSFGQGPVTGTPPFGSFGGGPFDTVNLGNLNVHFAIPVIHKAGRGMPFTYDLSYDSSIWSPVNSSGTSTWTPVPNWGWRGVTEIATGYVSIQTVDGGKDGEGCSVLIYSFVYHDPLGVSHNFWPTIDTHLGGQQCIGTQPPLPDTVTASDGSGYSLSVTSLTGSGTLTSRSGKVITPPFNTGSGAGTATDANGNQIKVNTSGQFFDTLSSTTPTLTVAGTAPSSTTFTYTGPSGSTHYTMNYGSYSVKTTFGCTGISEYSGTAYLVSSIVLPDTSEYTFTYETLGGYYTGRLASLTLPTGGTISYAYTGAHDGIVCPDGSTLGLTRTTPDSSTPWTYVRSGSDPTWTTKVTDPLTNETVLNFEKDSSTINPTNNFFETQRVVKQGATTLLTTFTCYNGQSLGNPANCATTGVLTPITQVDAYRMWPSGSQSYSEIVYDPASLLPTGDKEYDYGSAILRNTTVAYTNLGSNVGYRPTCVQVTAGTTPSSCGTITADTVSATTYSNYDSKGNVQTVKQWVSAVSTPNWLSRSFSYFSGGLVQTVTDVNSAQTTYGYAANNNCPANSFPTSMAEPLSLSRSMTWDCNGGVLSTATDENQKTTSYTYDEMWRLDKVSYPDGGITTTTYNTSSAPWDIATSTKQTSSSNVTTDTVLDGLGRVLQTQLTSDPSGVDYVDTSYDALGRVYSVSNPHRSTSSPTDGTTYYAYDALGRLTKTTNPDTKYKTFSYMNRAMEFTDESGIQKVYQSDGLGRLVNVCDGVGAGEQANNATATACNLDISPNGFLATYGYDALGNIVSVNLPGQLSRKFTYDGLSRMLTEDVPEINFVQCGTGGLTHSKCYTYDTGTAGDLYSSTFLNPSGTSVNAMYTWDQLHRLVTLEYPADGSNGYGYTYDASTWQTWNLQNGKGRLTSQSHSNGAAAAYSYDAMGRPVWEGSCAGANCYSTVRGMLHSYDYAGNVAIMTDSNGTSFTYTHNAAGQLTNVASSWSDTTHPGTLLSGATYNPPGELSTVTYGDGLPQTLYYDSLGRLTERQVGSAPTYRLFLTYNPNSTISEFQDNVTGRWDYTYDAFNRLATANLTRTGDNSPPHYTYSYDQFGNRWKQHLASGTGTEVDYTFSGNNKNSNFSYDYMGNVTRDGVCTANPCWSFDNAGHLTAGNGASYLYDGLGRRQQKTDAAGTVHSFVVDANGQPFDEYAPGLARVTGGFFDYEANEAEFNYLDQLGTPRLSTDYTGAVVRTEGALMGPFGDNFTETNTSLDFTGFAGGFWDSENNGDHFGAREYQNTHGSWLSPDPAGMAAVDITNPQTWNRYAYVTNNPVSFTDPTGLVDCPDGHYGCNCPIDGCPRDYYGPGNPGNGCDPSDASCDGGPGGGGFGGGGPGGGGPGSGGPSNAGGTPPSGGGTAPWQEWGSNPPWMSGAPGFPGSGCDFGVCNPIGNDFVSGITGAGTPDSPFSISVLVLAPYLQICGDFFCDPSGRQYGSTHIGLSEDIGTELALAGLATDIGATLGEYGFNVGIHGPHHFFPGYGRVPHFQINWWKIGVRGSGGAWRWPWPWWPF